jgi:hypothetical protein
VAGIDSANELWVPEKGDNKLGSSCPICFISLSSGLGTLNMRVLVRRYGLCRCLRVPNPDDKLKHIGH